MPAVAAARARAIGGGRRAGICWVYGLSHDVFMVRMGQPQTLPSRAQPCPALHVESLLYILVADRAEVHRWTLLFEVELARALPGTAAVSAHCRAARQLLPCSYRQ